MGMSAENDNISFKEQMEAKKREEARKATEVKVPSYTTMGLIKLKKKVYQLLIGEDDHKWYKAEYSESRRFDDMNRTPIVDFYNGAVTPLTDAEFNSYFKKKV